METGPEICFWKICFTNKIVILGDGKGEGHG